MTLLILLSCNKDSLTDHSPKTSPKNIFSASYNNGRLVFESQADFDQTINALEDVDESKLQAVFSKYYELGFMPSYPHYKKKETEKIVAFFQKKKASLPKVSSLTKGTGLKEKPVLEFDDPLISDDLFSSFLNHEREIIVGEKIYKYTYSGLLIASIEDSLALKKYVHENNINRIKPDPSTLKSGMTQLTPEINRFVALRRNEPCMKPQLPPRSPLHEIATPCGYDGGGGSSGGSNPPSTPSSPDHTSSLVEYVKDLMPCNYDEASAFGDWTPFGTRKVCYEYFTGNKRRTKTLYSNESYLIYSAISVKIKHQRHHSALFVEWWAADEIDEVALVITEAVFRITTQNMEAPTPPEIELREPEKNMIFYSGGKIIDPITSPLEPIGIWAADPSKLPSTPFDEEVIVHVFNNMNLPLLGDMKITVDKVTDFFWNNVYDLAIKAGNAVDTGGETTRITMLLTSDKTTIVHYVDLSTRQLNTKKIKHVLDDSYGDIAVSFGLSFDQLGQLISNPRIIGKDGEAGIVDYFSGVKLGNLLDFDDAYMNFTGVSRRGNEWRGSNMVYFAENLN